MRSQSSSQEIDVYTAKSTPCINCYLSTYRTKGLTIAHHDGVSVSPVASSEWARKPLWPSWCWNILQKSSRKKVHRFLRYLCWQCFFFCWWQSQHFWTALYLSTGKHWQWQDLAGKQLNGRTPLELLFAAQLSLLSERTSIPNLAVTRWFVLLSN